jgi:hypothetical protein
MCNRHKEQQQRRVEGQNLVLHKEGRHPVQCMHVHTRACCTSLPRKLARGMQRVLGALQRCSQLVATWQAHRLIAPRRSRAGANVATVSWVATGRRHLSTTPILNPMDVDCVLGTNESIRHVCHQSCRLTKARLLTAQAPNAAPRSQSGRAIRQSRACLAVDPCSLHSMTCGFNTGVCMRKAPVATARAIARARSRSVGPHCGNAI